MTSNQIVHSNGFHGKFVMALQNIPVKQLPMKATFSATITYFESIITNLHRIRIMTDSKYIIRNSQPVSKDSLLRIYVESVITDSKYIIRNSQHVSKDSLRIYVESVITNSKYIIRNSQQVIKDSLLRIYVESAITDSKYIIMNSQHVIKDSLYLCRIRNNGFKIHHYEFTFSFYQGFLITD